MNEQKLLRYLRLLQGATLDHFRIESLYRRVQGIHASNASIPRCMRWWNSPALWVKSCGAITVVAMVLLVVGGSATLTAAQVAIPGHALYGIKLQGERLAMTMARNGHAQLRLHAELAARRAEELALLQMRMRTANDEARPLVQQELVHTTRRLRTHLGNVRVQLAKSRLEKGQEIMQSTRLKEKVAVIETVVNDLTRESEVVEEVKPETEAVRQELHDLKEVANAVVLPTLNEAEILKAFEEVKRMDATIIRVKDRLAFRGISSTVGIEADLVVMKALTREAQEYFFRNQYSEADGLVKSTIRMGEKIIRALETREQNGLM